MVERGVLKIFQNVPSVGSLVRASNTNGTVVLIKNYYGVDGDTINDYLFLTYAGSYMYKNSLDLVNTVHSFKAIDNVGGNKQFVENEIIYQKLANYFFNTYAITHSAFLDNIKKYCSIKDRKDIPQSYQDFKNTCTNIDF